MEYEVVYLADIYDGVCPAIGSEEDPLLMAEERRIMYVGMTRAKEQLFIFNMKDHSSSFFSELFSR